MDKIRFCSSHSDDRLCPSLFLYTNIVCSIDFFNTSLLFPYIYLFCSVKSFVRKERLMFRLEEITIELILHFMEINVKFNRAVLFINIATL